MKKILIIEDDDSIVSGLENILRDEGYETRSVKSGQEGYRLTKEINPDLIILDLMLPGMSGLEICKRIRDEGMKMPIIMLTAKAEENDKVFGLELGADDYITKPFSVRELLARVKAHLRRGQFATTAGEATIPDEFVFGNVVVNLKRHEVCKGNERQNLTNREFLLLEYFIRHQGELLTRDRLLDEIWGYEVYPTTRTVDTHVRRLRKHIEPDPNKPRYIKTVHGAGYRFEIEGK
ncbi:MAG: response regulator transcription factor [candidate division KSB1 bacterium]|nr:response regulator transcription factor [candidate division KSB1 bacterium]MDZ7309804.1 response regulator transcription factor [candidate division KSB1 bacterium]